MSGICTHKKVATEVPTNEDCAVCQWVSNQSTLDQCGHLGTQLLTAFNSALGKPIGCGACRQTLLAFNAVESIDIDDAAETIYRIGLEIPETICPRADQRAWIAVVIHSMLNSEPMQLRAIRQLH